ncbi:hypothetical protein Sango_1630300 [Sesamum angolense]|uniref:Uncharacterized protein n=1 Tax=Sesamum angolense TaxID=2727404 RepID=A0AAE2BRF1_9LAMI|nr:hypothetical protein Sango_1630300 [Sesamum angolense]
MDPLPSVNKTYSMIMCVEKQRQVHMNFNDVNEGATQFADNFDKRKDALSEGGNYRRGVVSDKKNLRYEDCDRPGHDKNTCFKLHEVPEWYKEFNDQRRKTVLQAARVG